MPSFFYGILSIILLSLYMVFLSTVIFYKYTYLNHFPLLVYFSFLYKTITSYSHFLLSEINYSSPLHEDMPYLWFGGGLGIFGTNFCLLLSFIIIMKKLLIFDKMLKCFQVIAWSMFLQKIYRSINMKDLMEEFTKDLNNGSNDGVNEILWYYSMND